MNSDLDEMTSRREEYFQFFRNNQWPFEIMGNGHIRFQYDSWTYYLMIYAPSRFFQIIFPGFWNMENCADRQLLYIAANYAMNITKVSKILVEDDGVDVAIELFLSPKAAISVFDRCFDALHHGAREFCRKMGELLPSAGDDIQNDCPLPQGQGLAMVVFDRRGWRLIAEEGNQCRWQNKEGDHCLLVLHRGVTGLPALKQQNVTAIRRMVRNKVYENGGGIVSVDVTELSKTGVVITVAKYPQKPFGMTYEGELLLVFPEGYYSINIRCKEQGVTGVRDTAVLQDYEKRGLLKMNDDWAKSWITDPLTQHGITWLAIILPIISVLTIFFLSIPCLESGDISNPSKTPLNFAGTYAIFFNQGDNAWRKEKTDGCR